MSQNRFRHHVIGFSSEYEPHFHAAVASPEKGSLNRLDIDGDEQPLRFLSGDLLGERRKVEPPHVKTGSFQCVFKPSLYGGDFGRLDHMRQPPHLSLPLSLIDRRQTRSHVFVTAYHSSVDRNRPDDDG
ncbi:hypothetical protein [Brevundimonas naejangsanensis]|uniref:hypothetical protein n=1 Tax=Brevundimonas naejangsanensis TaxID=588932 RepID=UPI0014255938|nr:hypothetical protein [Brevundimonas naejangsanensis]